MGRTNPFNTVLEQTLKDIFSKKGVNSPFNDYIRQMQDYIEQSITDPIGPKIDAFRSLANRRETAPRFAPQPKSRPDPNAPPPAISNPRFRPDLPKDPHGQIIQTQKARPADTKLAQAGPVTQTDTPSVKPLQASPDLIEAVIQQESGGDPNAVSPKGAIGLMQIMPSTGAQPGFGLPSITAKELQDPAKNVKWGTDYLSKMLARYNGDTRRALIAYNAGHTVADRFNGNLTTLPAETQNYVARIEASLGGPGTLATAPSTVPAVQAPVTVPAPSAGRVVAPARPQRPQRQAPVLPFSELGPPGMAQAPVRRKPVVPVLWQQAVAKFLQSRDPKDLAVVPQGSMPVILALMGQAARSPL